MAKTPKVKKREVSLHSRAARRNTSPPSKDLLVKTTPAAKETEYKPWLHNAANAGISKKRKTKTLTRQQRMRQQKDIEKADAVEGKLEKKMRDSKRRGKEVKGRAMDWDELNEKLEGKKQVEEKKTGEEKGKMEDVIVPDLEQPLVIRGAEQTEMTEPVGVAKDVQAMAMPLPVVEDDEIL